MRSLLRRPFLRRLAGVLLLVTYFVLAVCAEYFLKEWFSGYSRGLAAALHTAAFTAFYQLCLKKLHMAGKTLSKPRKRSV